LKGNSGAKGLTTTPHRAPISNSRLINTQITYCKDKERKGFNSLKMLHRHSEGQKPTANYRSKREELTILAKKFIEFL